MTQERPELARAFRKSLKLSLPAMAGATGFSRSQIVDYELGARRGKEGPSAAISEAAWWRYALACAAVGAGLKLPF